MPNATTSKTAPARVSRVRCTSCGKSKCHKSRQASSARLLRPADTPISAHSPGCGADARLTVDATLIVARLNRHGNFVHNLRQPAFREAAFLQRIGGSALEAEPVHTYSFDDLLH